MLYNQIITIIIIIIIIIIITMIIIKIIMIIIILTIIMIIIIIIIWEFMTESDNISIGRSGNITKPHTIKTGMNIN